jgi:excisionase family DNA binding protein
MPRTKLKPPKTVAAPNAPSNGKGETPEVLTLEEAASYLRVPAEAVLRNIETEELPARQFGSDWRFFKVALQTWLGAARPKKGILNHIGRIKDDPNAEEMLRVIYARRQRPEAGNE